ncbi:WLM domain protein [Ceratobasidium sp. AG-Ba]|nr:WLM domain protein [Ceratobasidium sp. AG-Ba]
MSLVRAFTHLAGQPNAPEALHLLKRIADLAHPIMKRHGWVLPVFAEFFPDDPRLLGEYVDAGAKILIRLRPARSPGTFYPIEQLMGTMLHELTHNVHGPHDEKFYSFLSKLEDEYDALVVGGWQGTGFFAPGDKVGGQSAGWWGHSNPSNQFDTFGKRKALEAAEARRRIEAFGRGGRLGATGVASQSGKTRQELAAEAAERRRLDERSCAGFHPSADREATRAAIDSITDIVPDAELAEALALSRALAESAVQEHAAPSTVANASPQPSAVGTRSTDDDIIEIDSDSDQDAEQLDSLTRQSVRGRRCPKCTYTNTSNRNHSRCVMCDGLLTMPSDRTLNEPWNCSICTLENDSQVQVCQACGFSRNEGDWTPKRRRQGDPKTQARTETESSARRTWSCELCTYANTYASQQCSMCEAPCPLTVPQASGSRRSGRFLFEGKIGEGKAIAASPPVWNCRQCGNQGITHEFWMCRTCGWIKDNSGVSRN